MRNISDMNELYNSHNTGIFCEIIEKRFQIMYNT